MLKIVEKLPEVRWQEYRDLRIKAVEDSPQAFLDNPLETMKREKQEWVEWSKNCVFAEVDGKLVGMVGAITEQKEKLKHIAKIVGVFVDVDYRGQKIGEILLKKKIEQLSAVEGIKKIKLAVVVTQKPAFSLYTKLGFQKIGMERYAVKVEDTYFDEYLMELYL